jgi:hypothetical protein
MNDTTPTAVGDGNQACADAESENEGSASKISNIVFKIIVGLFGLGIGGIIGFIIALLTGLIPFEC